MFQCLCLFPLLTIEINTLIQTGLLGDRRKGGDVQRTLMLRTPFPQSRCANGNKQFRNRHMKYSTLLFGGWNALQVGRVFLSLPVFLPSPLRLHCSVARQSSEPHVRTRLSARRDLLRQEEKISIRVLGNATGWTWEGPRGRGTDPVTKRNRAEFPANRTGSRASNKRFSQCTFQRGKCNLKVAGKTDGALTFEQHEQQIVFK